MVFTAGLCETMPAAMPWARLTSGQCLVAVLGVVPGFSVMLRVMTTMPVSGRLDDSQRLSGLDRFHLIVPGLKIGDIHAIMFRHAA